MKKLASLLLFSFIMLPAIIIVAQEEKGSPLNQTEENMLLKRQVDSLRFLLMNVENQLAEQSVLALARQEQMRLFESEINNLRYERAVQHTGSELTERDLSKGLTVFVVEIHKSELTGNDHESSFVFYNPKLRRRLEWQAVGYFKAFQKAETFKSTLKKIGLQKVRLTERIPSLIVHKGK